MKFSSLFCFVILLMTMFAVNEIKADSGFTNDATKSELDGGLVYGFNGTIEGTDSLTSSDFDISEYDGGTTLPIRFGCYLSGGAQSTRNISCQWLASYDGVTYDVIDTVMTSDSAITTIEKTLNLNGKIRPYNKLLFFGTTGNLAGGIAFKGRVYLYKKE